MNLIFTFLAFVLFSGQTAAARSKNPINLDKPSDKLTLKVVPFISVEEICQDRVILDFELWYEAWSVQSVQKHNDMPGHVLDETLHSRVQTHLDQVKQYLAHLEEAKKRFSLFPPLHTDIKIRKLDKEVNRLLKNDILNKFENPQEQLKQQKEHGHYLPELIQEINKTPLDTNLINAVGDAFKKDWDVKELPKGKVMKVKLEELAEPLRNTLRLIIKTFTNKDHSVYNTLKEQDKNLIQLFFDTFKFLLSFKEIQRLTIIGLTGQEFPAELKQKFFTQRVFELINEKPTSFTNKIYRDHFLTIPTGTTDLEDLHKAARSQFFSWEFLYDFEGDDFDFQFDVVKKERIRGPRKQAKLRVLMYKVYLIARQDLSLFPNDQEISRQDILKKLFDFVLDNPEFDIPKTNPDEVLELPVSKSSQLVDPSKFRKYYVPLLHLLCKKITDCKLMSEQYKPTIVKNFENYGNFDTLKNKKLDEGILPADIVDEINKQIEHNEFAKLDEKLEILLDDEEETSESNEEDTLPIDLEDPKDLNQDKPERKSYEWKPKIFIQEEEFVSEPVVFDESPEVFMVKKKKPMMAMPKLKKIPQKVNRNGPSTLIKKLKEKHVSAFEPIVTKFLPPNEDLTDKSVEFIDKFLDKVDGTDNILKKNIMRSLLIKFVLNRHKIEKGSQISEKIIFNILNRMIVKIRGSYSFQKTLGLKNFFMRTITPGFGMNMATQSEAEQTMYHNDIVLFVFFACEDRFARAYKEKPKRNDLEEINAQTKITIEVLNSYFFQGQSASLAAKVKRQALRNKVMKNSLMMEKIPAYEFFTHFMDFFDYFKDIQDQASSVYSDYGRIYMNFYSFLLTLRSDIYSHITDPHQYVLDKLEACLSFTESVEEFTQNKYGPLCLMSHRKYAEMYYFYKTYLFSKDKLPQKQMTPYPGSSFDTHTRIFMNFALQSQVSNHGLTDSCKVNSDTPVCFTQTFFNILINYIHHFNLTPDYVIEQIKRVWTPKVRFHLIAAVEAVFLNIKNGNTKDYEKVIGLGKILETQGISLFKFSQQDVPELALYLKRTYRKRILEGDEVEATKFIQTILTVPLEKNDQDPLDAYFIYGGNVFLNYMKLFLLLAQSNNDYLRLAQYIVDLEAGASLLRMNTAENHADIINIIGVIGKSFDNVQGQFRILRSYMREKYEEANHICMNDIHTFTVGSKNGDEEDWDPVQDLFNDLEETEEEQVKLEDQYFDSVNDKLVKSQKEGKKIIYEQEYQVQFNESKSSIFNTEIFGEEPIEIQVRQEVVLNKDDDLTIEPSTKMFFNGKVVDKSLGIDLKQNMGKKIASMLNQNSSTSQTRMIEESGALDTNKMLSMLKDKDFIKKRLFIKKSDSQKFLI